MVAMLLVAPTGPGAEEHFTLDAVVRVYNAPFPNEGTHWAGEVGQLLSSIELTLGTGQRQRNWLPTAELAKRERWVLSTSACLAEVGCTK